VLVHSAPWRRCARHSALIPFPSLVSCQIVLPAESPVQISTLWLSASRGMTPLFYFAQGSSVCVSVWTEESVRVLSLDEAARLQAVVRLFGQKSACAQGLSCAVTDLERVKAQGHQLYLATNVTDHQR